MLFLLTDECVSAVPSALPAKWLEKERQAHKYSHTTHVEFCQIACLQFAAAVREPAYAPQLGRAGKSGSGAAAAHPDAPTRDVVRPTARPSATGLERQWY